MLAKSAKGSSKNIPRFCASALFYKGFGDIGIKVLDKFYGYAILFLEV